MYMSYCRFEGTLAELRACLWSVEEHADGNAEFPVSDREINCYNDMVAAFFNHMQEMGYIDWDVTLDLDALQQVSEQMRKGEEE